MSAQVSMSSADVQKLLSSADLLALGQMADAARRERHGDRATYVTVVEIAADAVDAAGDVPAAIREIRIVGRPASLDAAEASTASLKGRAGDRALTGFSLADIAGLAAEAGVSLTDAARRLAGAGLESIAETPIDALDDPLRAVQEVLAGGLQAWRLVVQRAPWDARLALIERAAALQDATGAIKAFAPLPRIDDAAAPSTGFDDVRTIAAARLMCGSIPHIQVDWPLYGPKLAQVALTYGADDIDGVSPVDDAGLGWRRAPVADVERNIQAAGRQPAARSGRFA